MATLNHTSFTLVKCTLVGIPAMVASHTWISIPFCSMYMIALLRNGLLLFIIIKERNLHEPMYLFLAMLVAADVLLSTTTMPKTLSIFWFNTREITFSACFTQMFFIHFIFVAESAILLAMAFHRYIAICDPLRYTTILTNTKIGKITVAAVIRGVFLVGSLIFFLKRLPYCAPNVIYHTLCAHGHSMAGLCLLMLNIWYRLTVALVTTGLDVVFIAVSYILILQAAFRLPSKDARLKALGTCGFHICVILMFYIPAFFSIFAYRFGGANIPHYIHILLANVFVIVPPMFNPIVYGVRTRQIRELVIHELCKAGKWF